MIEIKSEREIALIEESGRVVRLVLEEIKKAARPGATTESLNKRVEELIKDFKARPAFKGYRGFPKSICTSINEQVVHGIPGKRTLEPGDILSIDVGVVKNGYFADAAITIEIGDSVSGKAKALIKATRESLEAGIKEAVEGNRLFDISHAVQKYVETRGYSIVRDFVGHGIGKKMHEDPEIPNFGKPGTGARLKKGMVLAIEPMVNEGGYEIEILEDKWTAVTRDRSLSAHFEHTICVTSGAPKILT
ncbi:MAG: type I methionyl aminopeptidase [Candidatus Omnitrophica bacterium]|nr:type I methionyl aminopeptidase [Candidatus Omnitrophota bacterium]MBU4589384.1 type I methionyl aminopeptidase [Candidatus Omnitrophota bacterium]